MVCVCRSLWITANWSCAVSEKDSRGQVSGETDAPDAGQHRYRSGQSLSDKVFAVVKVIHTTLPTAISKYRDQDAVPDQLLKRIGTNRYR